MWCYLFIHFIIRLTIGSDLNGSNENTVQYVSGARIRSRKQFVKKLRINFKATDYHIYFILVENFSIMTQLTYYIIHYKITRLLLISTHSFSITIIKVSKNYS